MVWQSGGFWGGLVGAEAFEWVNNAAPVWGGKAAISAAGIHYIDRDDGLIYSAGDDRYGQIAQPPFVGFGTDYGWGVTSFPVGASQLYHQDRNDTTYALYPDGQLWGAGRFLNESVTGNEPTAQLVLAGVRSIASPSWPGKAGMEGYYDNDQVYVLLDGTAYGRDPSSHLLLADNGNLFGPGPAELSDINQMVTTGKAGLILKNDGTVLGCAGNMRDVAHPLGTSTAWLTPPDMPSDVVAIGANFYGIFVLTGSGELWAGGRCDRGTLGLNDIGYTENMRLVATGVRDMWGGLYAGFYIDDATGALYGFGYNYDALDGSGDANLYVPTALANAPADIVFLNHSRYLTIGITASGELWTCGRSGYAGEASGDWVPGWHRPAGSEGTTFAQAVTAYNGSTGFIAIATDGELWMAHRAIGLLSEQRVLTPSGRYVEV